MSRFWLLSWGELPGKPMATLRSADWGGCEGQDFGHFLYCPPPLHVCYVHAHTHTHTHTHTHRALLEFSIFLLHRMFVNILEYCIECVLAFIFSIISFYTLTFSFTVGQIIQYWIKLEDRNGIFTQAATLFRTIVPEHRVTSWFFSAIRHGIC
jgi:hypothetical protein